MDRSLVATMDATQSQAAAQGMGASGPLMQSLKNNAVNSLKARSHFILGQLLRCLTAHRVPLTDENLIEATTLLRETIETQGYAIRSRLFSLGAFTVQWGVNPARQQLQAEFDQEAPRIIARLTTGLEAHSGCIKRRKRVAPAGPHLQLRGSRCPCSNWGRQSGDSDSASGLTIAERNLAGLERRLGATGSGTNRRCSTA